MIKNKYAWFLVSVITGLCVMLLLNFNNSRIYRSQILDLEIMVLDVESENIDLLEDIATLECNLKSEKSKVRYLEREVEEVEEVEVKSKKVEIITNPNKPTQTSLGGSEPVVEVETEKVVETESNKVLLGTFEATAYTDDTNSQGKWVGQTATGRTPAVGVIAVDPKVIPLNTKLYVEGYGECVAGDVGGAIKGQIIDVFKDTRSECKSWGRKQVKVWEVK